MLTMSAAQLEVLSRAHALAAYRGVTEKLAEVFPEKAFTIGEEAWRALINRFVEDALGYELQTERAVIRFAEIRLDHDEAFPAGERWRWARKILEAPGPDGEHKIGMVDTVLIGSPLW